MYTPNEFEYLKKLEAEGIVNCFFKQGNRWCSRLMREDECIKVGRRWYPKIEFLMNKFGEYEIDKEIKNLAPDPSKPFSLFTIPDWAKKYRDWRDHATQAAVYFEETKEAYGPIRNP